MGRPRRTDRRRPRIARDAFVVATAALATGVAALAVQDLASVPPGARGLVLALALCLLVSEVRPMQWHPRAGDFTASWGFAGAAVLVAPVWVGMAGLAIASCAGDLVRRKPPVRVVFNAASLAASLGIGGLVLRQLWPSAPLTTSHAPLGPGFVAAMVTFAVTVYVVNLALTATVIRLDRGVAVREVLAHVLRHSAVDDALLLLLAPVFAIVGLHSVLLVPLPALAVYAVHRSATQAAASRMRASVDGLTGLANRVELRDRLRAAIPGGATLVVLDLDGFKGVNDRLGHPAGDRVLEIAAQRLQAATRPDDVVARLGGDEFAVILHRAVGHDATASVERIRATLRRPFEIDGIPIPMSASVGRATAPLDSADVDELLDLADTAMLAEKMSNRALPEPGVERRETFASTLSLLRDLKRAIAADELVVEYQPQIDLVSERTVGFEALVRWRRNGETVLPGDFVHAAEHTELIGDLTEFVLAEALRTASMWWEMGEQIPVSVNVSARSLTDPRFVDVVGRLLAGAGLPGEALEVEITEHTLLGDIDGARLTLEALAELGVTVAIDDFGTGYSSFEHLRSLPIHRLKIDRTFVGQVATHGLDARFVAPMIVLGHNLGLRVVAEGVEQHDERKLLQEMGCDVGQGWHFGYPLSGDDALGWLAGVHASTGE